MHADPDEPRYSARELFDLFGATGVITGKFTVSW
jgi:hypothetical protein